MSKKLFFLLVTIPVVSISSFFIISYDLFSKDRLSLAMGMTSEKTQSVADQVSQSITRIEDSLERLLQGISDTSKERQKLKNRFSSEHFLREVILFKKKENPEILAHLRNKKGENQLLSKRDIDSFIKNLTEDGIYLKKSQIHPNIFFYGRRLLEIEKWADKGYLLTAFRMPHLSKAFDSVGSYRPYLVDNAGHLLVQPNFLRKSDLNTPPLSKKTIKKVTSSKAPAGVYIGKEISDDEIVSYSQLRRHQLSVIVTKSRVQALQVITTYFKKSILFLCFFLSLTVILSLYFSRKVSKRIEILSDSTAKIADGEFDTKVEISSDDEFEDLALKINDMAQKLKNMIANTAEKAKLENELSMVRDVQSNIFPELSCYTEQFEIELFFEAANKSGGDWFNYTQKGNHLILWIGDATGHGAPASLVTAAAKAVAAVLEDYFLSDQIDVSFLMRSLNLAVHATTRGAVMMTFSIVSLDLETGEIEYCNASHEPPVIIPYQEDLKKKDLEFMLDVGGPRLGEAPKSIYKVSKTVIRNGDQLMLCTDGLYDLENENQEKIGEAKVLRLLTKLFNSSQTIKEVSDKLQTECKSYRGDAILADDLMYMIVKYKALENLAK